MEEQSNDVYSSIVAVLVSMFGEVLCEDAIASIVESCDGDVEESANIIMNITTDVKDSLTNENKIQVTDIHLIPSIEQSEITEENNDNNSSNIQTPITATQKTQNTADQAISQEVMLYRQALLSPAASSGAIPKCLPKKSIKSKGEAKELMQILELHAKGTRTLILIRGPSGSGKSYLAKSVVDMVYNSHVPELWSMHILSTDDYFLRGGIYCYDKTRICDAHMWNQERSCMAMSRGMSPVIIDNTNIEIWEMEPYVKAGIKNGYVIQVLEPRTPWAWKVNQLVRKNVHNVPLHSIERMVNNYQQANVNVLIQKLGLTHYVNRIPLKVRLIPEFIPNIAFSPSEPKASGSREIENKGKIKNKDKIEEQMQNLQFGSDLSGNVCTSDNKDKITIEVTEGATGLEGNMLVYEVEKQLEEIAKIENEWDNGENWDENSGKKQLNEMNKPTRNIMPQRKERSTITPTTKNMLSSLGDIQDWTIFMPKWTEEVNPATIEHSPILPIKKVSSSTCIEIGDTDLYSFKNSLKIITAKPRDINEFYISDKNEKIPEKWMLDKSTSTNNDTMHTGRCKNEDKLFNEFRKLFKYVARGDLRDVFDKCNGDVNWAVDIVLSDMRYKELHTKDENDLLDSEVDDGNDDNNQCDCIAAYNVIPDQNTNISKEIKNEAAMDTPSSPFREKRKIKKDNPLSDEVIKIKQQIEENVVISDDHYSRHCLKIRKFRRGEIGETAEHVAKVSEENSELELNEQNLASTSNVISDEISDIETISAIPEVEETISIDVCQDLMSQLDEQLGWSDMIYSENISTKINIPMSIINELNALWIESLLHQIETNGKQHEIMVKQDEEFARQLAQKEEELVKLGNEPELPDLKEIMDMEYALSLYQKDVAQWKNNIPNDIATIMTKDKLKNLFPELSADSLTEILMAHENNFKATVESLLVSTGRGDVLLINNGISKFIMEKETEQRHKLIQQEELALSESEWPALQEKIDMDLVKKYRQKAEYHVRLRNMTHQKAQDFVRRGMLPAASYYSDIASYHKLKYEQSNSCAAASLMHLHVNSSPNKDTINLHYLHVNEAKEALDMFIDMHIQQLRDKSGPFSQRLFFITGRGLHSNGKPRIKPAVQKRLAERGVAFSESNPGLLNAKIVAEDRLTSELD